MEDDKVEFEITKKHFFLNGRRHRDRQKSQNRGRDNGGRGNGYADYGKSKERAFCNEKNKKLYCKFKIELTEKF